MTTLAPAAAVATVTPSHADRPLRRLRVRVAAAVCTAVTELGLFGWMLV